MITDQAERLRKLASHKAMGVNLDMAKVFNQEKHVSCRVISFLGNDNEAIGNSNLVANLAVAMQRSGKKIIVVDAYAERADSSMALGINPKFSIEDLLQSKASWQEIIYTGHAGVKYVKIGRLISRLEYLDFPVKDAFFKLWLKLEASADIILVNEPTAAFSLLSKEAVVLTSSDSKVVTQAYERLKKILDCFAQLRPGIIVNLCYTQKEGVGVSRKISQTVKKFLNREVEELGYVLLETEVIKALKTRYPFVMKYPVSQASGSVNTIAARLLDHNRPVMEEANIRLPEGNRKR